MKGGTLQKERCGEALPSKNLTINSLTTTVINGVLMRFIDVFCVFLRKVLEKIFNRKGQITRRENFSFRGAKGTCNAVSEKYSWIIAMNTWPITFAQSSSESSVNV